ncbi:MAG: hypothetical protein EAZ83_28240 [Oscillatoriales cyanobacterium]|nr:MAG: hypothetical protein EAZ83_28240 [Oscillatoriales cyanobacterium]
MLHRVKFIPIPVARYLIEENSKLCLQVDAFIVSCTSFVSGLKNKGSLATACVISYTYSIGLIFQPIDK